MCYNIRESNQEAVRPTEDNTMRKTLILTLLLCMLSSCAHALTMTGLETDTVDRTWEDHAFFARMEALTGVAVQAHGESDREAYAKMLLDMENGVITADALFKAGLSREQEYRLMESGAVVDLAPYIGEHMPNLSALLEQHPHWKAEIALEDGRIASLPLLNMRERQVCVWINTAWLEALGLSMPQTMDELTAALAKMQGADLNGNGKRDEVAADLLGVYELRWLLPYFGVVADDYSLARREDGSLVFAPELAQYREFIAQMKRWYDEGILSGDVFTGTHSAAALGGEDEDEPVTSGMLVSMTPYTHVPMDAISQYQALLMPGPDGSVRWRDLLGEVWTGCFAVTRRCEDIPAALRWADALYGEAGALLCYAGVQNEDFTVSADGTWSLVTDALRDVNDIRAKAVIYTGEAAHGLYPGAFIHRIDSPLDRHVFAQSERVREVSGRVVPAHALGRAQQARASELMLGLGAVVDRGVARFVTGEVELTDENYAAWLGELQAAGSAELVKLFADAQE